jgi:hypothetical protein
MDSELHAAKYVAVICGREFSEAFQNRNCRQKVKVPAESQSPHPVSPKPRDKGGAPSGRFPFRAFWQKYVREITFCGTLRGYNLPCFSGLVY